MKTSRKSERGSALLLSIVLSFIVISIAGAYLGLTVMRTKELERTVSGTQALYVAEAAAASFIFRLNSTGSAAKPSLSAAENITIGKDLPFLGGGYTVTPSNYGDGSGKFWLLEVEGKAGSQSRRLEVILSKDPGGVFWNAIFAGNASGSDDYSLGFSSGGTNRDIIKGDVYSGGKVTQSGGAQILPSSGTGSAQVMYASDDKDGYDNAGATQSATPPNFVHGSQPNLDIAAMNYDAKAKASKDMLDGITNTDYDASFVNVTASLDKNGKVGNVQNTAGDQGLGQATQIVDQSDPAHLFRMNPTDGASERVKTYGQANTAKNDYFIEDATRPAANGSAQGNWVGSDGGMRLNVQPNGNNKAYYFDGNLWASNSPAFTFQFENNTGADMKMTWIVKGNVYLTDNLLYDTNAPNKNDALAIIAIEDPAYPNYNPEDFIPGGKGYDDSRTSDTTRGKIKEMYESSKTAAEKYSALGEYARDYNKLYGSGNVFFGDPGGGTTERFESFLYAQNNFYDHNLGGSGTNLTNIYGNMTAGNQIQIQRKTDGDIYKPMLLTFDERIRTGKVSLPGLPGNPTVAAGDYIIASWKVDPKKRKGVN